MDFQDPNKQDKKWYAPVVSFYVKTTAWVAGPALLAFLLNSYFELSQIKFFILIFIAFLITVYGIYKEIKDYKKTLN